MEWAGLLHTLLNGEDTECTLSLGRSELPSSTFFNRGWMEEESVVRDFDHLAHDPEYQHPAFLWRELRLIQSLAQQIHDLCQAYPEVIVTSDHGLTRFAAQGERVACPEGYTVHKYGRYAQPMAPSTPSVPPSGEWLNDNGCLVLAGRVLFAGGARPPGEVHGGATLEETLVPVLRVRRRRAMRPTVTFRAEPLRPDLRGQMTLELELTAPVRELRLAVGGRIYDAESITPERWRVILVDLAGRPS